MTKPKLSKIAVTMRNGQMFHNVARNGTPKRLTDPQPTFGAVRQTKPSHEFCHGAPAAVQDEPLQKNWEGKQVAVHPSMQSRDKRGKDADGFAILEEAGRLGMPKG